MFSQNAVDEPQELFERQKKLAYKFVETKLKKAEKRVEDRKCILAESKDWSKVNHEGLLLQSHLFKITKGMKEIVVSDWEQAGAERTISLNPRVLPKDQVAAYFRRSKKLRLGLPHAERMLQTAEKELEACLLQKQSLDAAIDSESLAAFLESCGINRGPVKPKATLHKKIPAKPYHTFVTEAGLEIWVGKSAKDNDKLTFHCANGLDWWLHANNYPGSHVVIRCPKDHELDAESLNDAAELALRYSKAKDCGDGEVCLTKVNALSRVKGIPGKVMLSKPRILRIVLNDERWKRLKKH